MATSKRIKELKAQTSGMPMWARFTLSMTIVLAGVLSASGYFIYRSAMGVSGAQKERLLVGATTESAKQWARDVEYQRQLAQRDTYLAVEQQVAKDLAQFQTRTADTDPTYGPMSEYLTGLEKSVKLKRVERDRIVDPDAYAATMPWKQVGTEADMLGDNEVVRWDIQFLAGGSEASLLRPRDTPEDAPFSLIVPAQPARAEESLLFTIAGFTFVALVLGAVVAVWVATQVAKPMVQLAEDVAVASTHGFKHNEYAKGGREVAVLGRAIDRMTADLEEARETEIELQVRQREVEVAGEVRQALLPQTTPRIPGYDLGSEHVSSAELGGDFQDFIELAGGRIGLLVCEVNGKGLPAALVGATARAYLRAELGVGGDVKEALHEVNRQLARDMRSGVAVTALYALVDPVAGIATVACAGHKIPLIRYTAADKKVRLVQPEGIALGFDKGPVFERALATVQVPIEPGDRLVIVNSGAVVVANAEGVELGEKGLYSQVMRHGAQPSDQFLARVRAALETYSEGVAMHRDISLVTVARKA